MTATQLLNRIVMDLGCLASDANVTSKRNISLSDKLELQEFAKIAKDASRQLRLRYYSAEYCDAAEKAVQA